MTLHSGSDVILKIGDGGEPESFATIGGLRDTDFVFGATLSTAPTSLPKDGGNC